MRKPLSKSDRINLWIVRAVTFVGLVMMLAIVVTNRRSYSTASLAIYFAIALVAAASAWIKPLVRHWAYGSALSLWGWSMIWLESWMRHGRVTSFYACLVGLMGIALASALWINRRSAQDDNLDSLEDPTA